MTSGLTNRFRQMRRGGDRVVRCFCCLELVAFRFYSCFGSLWLARCFCCRLMMIAMVDRRLSFVYLVATERVSKRLVVEVICKSGSEAQLLASYSFFRLRHHRALLLCGCSSFGGQGLIFDGLLVPCRLAISHVLSVSHSWLVYILYRGLLLFSSFIF